MDTIRTLIEMGFKVSVAGGIDMDILRLFQGLDISVFIIGRAIYGAPDPTEMAKKFRMLIAELWS